jgi:hypothetical protein
MEFRVPQTEGNHNTTKMADEVLPAIESVIAQDYCDILMFLRKLVESNIILSNALVETPDDDDYITAIAENKQVISSKKLELERLRVILETQTPGISDVLQVQVKSRIQTAGQRFRDPDNCSPTKVLTDDSQVDIIPCEEFKSEISTPVTKAIQRVNNFASQSATIQMAPEEGAPFNDFGTRVHEQSDGLFL